MSNIAAVRTAYETEIAKLTDPICIAEANACLDNLIQAMTAAAAISGQNIASYTVAQRSVTRVQLKSAQDNASSYRGELRRLLYGNSVVPDLRGGFDAFYA